MGPPTDLLLQYKPSQLAACRSVTTYLHDGTEQRDPLHEEICRLEAWLAALESEHKKIDAFKKELPFCMQLLHDAIEASKEQLAVWKSSSQKQLQSLLSYSYVDKGSTKGSNNNFGTNMSNKSFYEDNCEYEQEQKRMCMNWQGDTSEWMKVWTPRADVGSHNQEFLEERTLSHIQEQAFSSSAKPLFHPKPKLGGAFTPFSRDSRLVQPTARLGAINPADLAIKCPNSEITGSLGSENGENLSCTVPIRPLGGLQEQLKSSVGLEPPAKTAASENGQQQVKVGGLERKIKAAGDTLTASQLIRKARRSWSPELHRRFVDALQKLGGAQATPKQIREVMKVEGLTNDEVKSHLQKYRLHSKRLGSSQLPSSHGCQVDLAGETWPPSRQALQTTRAISVPSWESQSCEMSVTNDVTAESYNQYRASSEKLLCCEKQPLWVQSQRVRGGSSQLVGQPGEGCCVKSEVDGEESVGEAVKSENSGLIGNHLQEMALHESHQMEEPSFDDSQSHCIGEDYRVGEESEDCTS